MANPKLSFRVKQELYTELLRRADLTDQKDLSKYLNKILEDHVAGKEPERPQVTTTVHVGNRKFKLDPRDPNKALIPLAGDRIAEMVRRNEEKLKAKKQNTHGQEVPRDDL